MQPKVHAYSVDCRSAWNKAVKAHNLCRRNCIYVYIHVCVCVCVCVYIYIYIYIYSVGCGCSWKESSLANPYWNSWHIGTYIIYSYTCMQRYMSNHTLTAGIHGLILSPLVLACVCAYIYIYTYIYIYIYICILTFDCVCVCVCAADCRASSQARRLLTTDSTPWGNKENKSSSKTRTAGAAQLSWWWKHSRDTYKVVVPVIQSWYSRDAYKAQSWFDSYHSWLNCSCSTQRERQSITWHSRGLIIPQLYAVNPTRWSYNSYIGGKRCHNLRAQNKVQRSWWERMVYDRRSYILVFLLTSPAG